MNPINASGAEAWESQNNIRGPDRISDHNTLKLFDTSGLLILDTLSELHKHYDIQSIKPRIAALFIKIPI